MIECGIHIVENGGVADIAAVVVLDGFHFDFHSHIL